MTFHANRDNLHEMSMPFFLKTPQKYLKILSAEIFTQHVRHKVNSIPMQYMSLYQHVFIYGILDLLNYISNHYSNLAA